MLLLLLVSGGCNRSGLNLAHVEGVVTLDDKPVEDAAVLFLPDDPTMGPPASGTTDAEGRYTLITANQPGAAIGATSCGHLEGEYSNHSAASWISHLQDDLRDPSEICRGGILGIGGNCCG